MKNTRIERLKQSKRAKQVTKILTIGLLVCPLAIGTFKALANEAETTPTTEQTASSEAVPTAEENAPKESINQTNESSQTVDSIQADEATNDQQVTEETKNGVASRGLEATYPERDELAALFRTKLADYQAQADKLISLGATDEQMTTIKNILSEIPRYISFIELGPGDPYVWANEIDSLIIPQLENAIQKVKDELSSNLDWTSYDAVLNNYREIIDLKDIYEHFGLMEFWNFLNSKYDYFISLKQSGTLTQEQINLMSGTVGEINLTYVDAYELFEYDYVTKIKEYRTSVKLIYDDSTNYTLESKQVFNEAWTALNEKLQNDNLWGQDRELFGAYQALKAAEQNLVKIDNPLPPTEEKLNTTNLTQTISKAEELNSADYTTDSWAKFITAFTNAKDILARAEKQNNLTRSTPVTQADIDQALSALETAISGLVKADTTNNTQDGNDSSNGTENRTTNSNSSNNGTSNTNNQSNNNNSQNSKVATNKPTGNNTSKDGLPQTGEQSTTTAVIAGLSLIILSIVAWFKRKRA